MFIQDSENTLLWSPEDYDGNKALGSWTKVLTLQQNLFYEDKEKYHNKFMAHLKAKQELESLPLCFDKCISSMDGGHGLTGAEKNCIRECYLKRVSVTDEMNMYFLTRASFASMKRMKERLE